MIYRFLFIVALIWSHIVLAENIDPIKLRSFGEDNPVLIYVFTSASCPHCAHFHEQVMPSLKEKFVQTGRAQIKIVDMPYDTRALQAMQVARCMDEKTYDRFMKKVYENQAVWGYGRNPESVLKEYAIDVGMTREDFESCLSNKELRSHILMQRDNLSDLYRVRGMPTTVVIKDGKSVSFSGTDKKEILIGIENMLRLK